MPTYEHHVIENVNDSHVEDNIASFSSVNNLEQFPLIHDLSLVQELHDSFPFEITYFEVIQLKVDANNSSNRDAFHCL